MKAKALVGALVAAGIVATGAAAYRAGRLKEALRYFTRAYELVPSAELDFDLDAGLEQDFGFDMHAIDESAPDLRRPAWKEGCALHRRNPSPAVQS